MERYQDALHTYEETLTFELPSPSTRCYMGECLERIGDLERAESYYRDSLKLDPRFADAFVGLGVGGGGEGGDIGGELPQRRPM